MTQSPSASPCSTSHSTVPWAKSLISRSTATPQPSIIIPVWPVGTNDGAIAGARAAARAARARPTSCRSRSRCRPSGSPACPARGGGRRRSPSGPAGAGSRRSRCPRAAAAAANSGSSPRNVCSPDRTSRPAAIAVEDDRPPRRRQPAAGRRDADQQRVGRARQRERLVERRDDRDVVAGQVRVDVLAGLRRIEDRDDVVASVADDAVRGLGVVGAELPFGEDDEAAQVGRSHRGSVGKRATSPEAARTGIDSPRSGASMRTSRGLGGRPCPLGG